MARRFPAATARSRTMRSFSQEVLLGVELDDLVVPRSYPRWSFLRLGPHEDGLREDLRQAKVISTAGSIDFDRVRSCH